MQYLNLKTKTVIYKLFLKNGADECFTVQVKRKQTSIDTFV